MSDFREEEKLGKVYDTQLTRRLLKYLRPYQWWVAFAVSMTFGVAVTGTRRALSVSASAIDRYIVPGFAHTIVAREPAWRWLAWIVG